jgi:hypothetical protein
MCLEKEEDKQRKIFVIPNNEIAAQQLSEFCIAKIWRTMHQCSADRRLTLLYQIPTGKILKERLVYLRYGIGTTFAIFDLRSINWNPNPPTGQNQFCHTALICEQKVLKFCIICFCTNELHYQTTWFPD